MADLSYVNTLMEGALGKQDLASDQVKQELGEGVARVASDIAERSNWYMQVAEHQGAEDLVGLAEAFAMAQIDAVRRELCDPETKSLKQQYKVILGDSETSQILYVLISAILSVITPEYRLPSIVVPLALWLAKVQVNLWCSSMSNEQLLSVSD
jgi:hypothetical protein